MAFRYDKKRQQLWKIAENKANRNGFKSYFTTVTGEKYYGEWKNNKRHGRGTYVSPKAHLIYEGEWQNDHRHGLGCLSAFNVDCKFIKIYSGHWKNGKRHGYGENWYNDVEYYEGEWEEGKRCGWGRMFFADGTIYEGQWKNDMRHGMGMLRFPNDNRYEGEWAKDKKHGNGKMFFLDRRQMMTGLWINGISKTNVMTDIMEPGEEPPDIRYNFDVFETDKCYIPKCELKGISEVFKRTKAQYADMFE